MIFRITVNDNDFTEVLEKFANNLFDRVYWAKDKPEEMSSTEWYEKLYKPKQEIQKLMNPNITSSLTKEDKVLLRAAVFLEWCDYLDSLPVDDEMDAETKEYLKKNFTVSVSFRFTDKWENGEVYYWFQHADSYIII